MKIGLSSLLDLLGVICILTAAFAFDWRAGLALAGVALIVTAVLVDDEDPTEMAEGGEP